VVNVIVVFHKPEVAKNIRNLLVRNGVDVLAVCTTGAQVMALVDNLDEGLVICGYRFADMLHTELREFLPNTFEMLLIATQLQWSECTHSEIVCLSMPVKSVDLLRVVNSILDNILQRRKRRKDRPRLRSSEEKAVIESAKFMLMNSKNYSEEEAHRYIQKQSMDSGTNMVETAQMILNFSR